MGELGRRVATAVVLIPLVVVLIEFGPTSLVAGVFALIVAAGAWEWAGFCGWTAVSKRVAYVVVTAAMLLGLALTGAKEPIPLIVYLGLLWWAAALLFIVIYQSRADVPELPALYGDGTGLVPWFIAVCGWLVLVPAWYALMLLHAVEDVGPHLVLGLMVVIWCADIGAYFAGRRFGKNKLAVRVSPGKTWEGVGGGAVVAIVACIALGVLIGASWAAFALLGIATVIVSVLGDLTESLFKRAASVKDAGSILPGHGGILDRIDSLTAGAPLFWVGALWALTA